MKIETEAELLKLTRLLQIEEGTLDLLSEQRPEALAAFRSSLSSFFYEQHQDSYQRLAGISKLVPAGASAKLATGVLGSVLSAGIASELPADRATKLAAKLPDDFMARLSLHLEPKHSRDLLAALPDDLVETVAKALLAQEEYITLARFVAVIQPSALQKITANVQDGEAMVKIGLYLEDKSKLDSLLGMLTEEQQRSTVQAATEHGLWPAVLSLNEHLGQELRAKLGNMVAEQGEDVLTNLIHIASEQRLWTNLLQAVNAMDAKHQQMIINLPALREAPVMESLISTVNEEDSWPELLAMLPLLDQAHLGPVLDVLTTSELSALGNALDKAGDSDLLGFFGHLPDNEVPRVAKLISEHSKDAYQAFAQRNSDAHELAALNAQIG